MLVLNVVLTMVVHYMDIICVFPRFIKNLISALQICFCQQPINRKTPRVHLRSKDWYMIEFVITRRCNYSCHFPCFSSDHFLLCSEVDFHLTPKKRHCKPSIKKKN